MDITRVDRKTAKRIRDHADRHGDGRGRALGELAVLLLAGEMVFVRTDDRGSLVRSRRTLRRRDLRVRTQAGTMDGLAGFYVWAEPLD